jgi:hypothetical protein
MILVFKDWSMMQVCMKDMYTNPLIRRIGTPVVALPSLTSHICKKTFFLDVPVSRWIEYRNLHSDASQIEYIAHLNLSCTQLHMLVAVAGTVQPQTAIATLDVDSVYLSKLPFPAPCKQPPFVTAAVKLTRNGHHHQ